MHNLIVADLSNYLSHYPDSLVRALFATDRRSGGQFYLVGGSVRDYLLGLSGGDLDVTVPHGALSLAKMLVAELGGGTIVDLSGPDDEAFRVVWGESQVDISSYRVPAATIEDDLRRRDYTINAMAVRLGDMAENDAACRLIDPLDGRTDVHNRRLRHCPGAFTADPVRLLRGYRFAACLGFSLLPDTLAEIQQQGHLITTVAGERVAAELRLIFASAKAAGTLRDMDGSGLLRHIVPELYRGEGVRQPEFHHLDVFGHSFLALDWMEKIIADPTEYYPGHGQTITSYLAREGRRQGLKWAALMHDIGKPATRQDRTGKTSRVTFYRHDEVGREMFALIAGRLRLSRSEGDFVGQLIAMHMHPFHLCNVRRLGRPLSRRAALKLCHRAGDHLPGLFLLAMADSLASRGEKKPPEMEDELLRLFNEVDEIYQAHIRPVFTGPRLLTGNDLIHTFGLSPGPQFSHILSELEVARVEGRVADREEACRWLETFLKCEKQR